MKKSQLVIGLWGQGMAIFKRIAPKYSVVRVETLEGLDNRVDIIQLYQVDNNCFIVESVPVDVWPEYLASLSQEQQPTKSDGGLPQEVTEALDTVLNTDPFGLKQEGKTLKEIYKTCPEWWDTATKKLKNKFIKGKMDIIDKYVDEQAGQK